MNPAADPNRTIDIHVPVLTRVEGEGSLEFTARNGKVEKLYLRIYEPPRLFEKFLEGQDYTEVPTIAARVCGVCPIAYQMTSIRAMETLFGVPSDPWIHAMRRVIYYGEWLQSHTLHVNLFAAPDFLGFPDAISMAAKYPEEVRRGMRLQGLGNDLLRLLGGRSVHPIGMKVGGFHRAPPRHEVADMVDKLLIAREDARQFVAWAAGLPYPVDEQEFISVAIQHPQEYGITEGRLVSDHGLRVSFEDYPTHFREYQVAHSTAYYSLMDGRSYFLGPLARMNLNFDRLPQPVQALAQELGIRFPSHNMFMNVVARALECYLAVEDSLRILSDYQLPARPFLDVTPRAGIGHYCTEAPRGMIYHRFELDDAGRVSFATMIPPTSQNQLRIEQNLQTAMERFGLEHSDDELRQFCEQVIRNYDPCLSCSTHFLRLEVHRD
ncbi:MAG: nickel-dependent hydrogenase large subunit [Proteobacteria bacterium]|nr:nickel-dependent hydrogenase large subunit [Pseudomonadota bacterium]